MGQEIDHVTFSQADIDEFHQRLRNETKILKGWFDKEVFCTEPPMTGIELEAWLINDNFLPEPSSDHYIDTLKDPKVVPEISKFNFELNSDPYTFDGKFLSKLYDEVDHVWQKCEKHARSLGHHGMLIGTLATLRPNMLELQYLSPQNRYFVMNKRVMELREGRPVILHLEGKDELYMEMDSVIAECAATSLQIHLGVTQHNAKRYFNASMIASAFMMAISANSPYFFGKELWDESRIAVFEQAVEVDSFRSLDGRMIRRVTFGNGYLKDSLFELFLENLDGYRSLLPEVMDEDPNWLGHLRLHNGTIWRWNRPIVGITSDAKPHLRIEHRTPSAGPTIRDSIANTAFFLGLVEYLATMPEAPEDLLDFSAARDNFYNAAKQSFYAKVKWIDGKEYDIQSLLLNQLYPKAVEALQKKGVDQGDIDYYMGEIIYNRLKKGINGALWQKAYIHTHGKRFQEMVEAYLQNQYDGKPVHEWGV
jgi:hypothetical protein